MNAATWIFVALLGGAGALARFLLDAWVSGAGAGKLPAGTFMINISGSLILGLMSGLAWNGNTLLLAGTATIGSYTTFSTWMLETHRLREEAEFRAAFLNVAVSMAVGLGAAALGHALGAAL
ncbi:MAG: fluoride efflux transporter CrcB [Solirubrobacterales bacterium]|nr:fluoride efflux transporter CrcB [Solirubrobacterales bacterium]